MCLIGDQKQWGPGITQMSTAVNWMKHTYNILKIQMYISYFLGSNLQKKGAFPKVHFKDQIQ